MIRLLILALAISAHAGPKTYGWYGLRAGDPPFKGMKPAHIAETLSLWGINLVVGGAGDANIAGALKKQGIRRAAVLSCFQGHQHWRSHPESRPIRADGSPIPKLRWYAGVCPSQPWLRARLKKTVVRLAKDKRIDGVWLDFIRYPVLWETPQVQLWNTCFDPLCVAKFQRDTGITLPEDLASAADQAAWILKHHPAAWAEWKGRNIADFVGELRAAAKKEDENFTLGVFVLPWSAEEFGGALRRVAGQDLARLAQAADVLSPMPYHAMMGREVAWVGTVPAHALGAGAKRVVPIIAAGEGEKAMPHADLRRALRLAAEAADGVLVFPQSVLALSEHRADLPNLFSK